MWDDDFEYLKVMGKEHLLIECEIEHLPIANNVLLISCTIINFTILFLMTEKQEKHEDQLIAAVT